MPKNLFYEDVIEPIAIQLSQVLTDLIIAPADRERGFKIICESNKLQFASNNTKLNVSQQLFDRGILKDIVILFNDFVIKMIYL